MKITPPSQPPSNLYLSGHGDARRPWKVGELVRAIATKQHSSRELTLQIGKEQYTAYAKTPVPIGQPMLMRVLQAGRQPVLELVHDVNLGTRSGGAGTALTGLLSTLMRFSTGSGNGQIPHQAQEAVLRLLRLLPEPGNLAGTNELRQLITDSGSFLEAKLLQAVLSGSHQLFDGDWKALLLRLRHALHSLSPGETRRHKMLGGRASLAQKAVESFAEVDASASRSLLRQVDEALIKIELNQLSSRSSDDPNRQIWVVELPVKGLQGGEPEWLRIRIERDSSGSAVESEANWSLVLQMDVAPLGRLRINLSLRRGEVSVHISAEEIETARLLRGNLQQLEQSLAQRGLEVGAVTGSAGQATTSSNPSNELDLLA